MSQLFPIKDLCKTKDLSNENYCAPNKGAQQHDFDETIDDFGKILDQREGPSNPHESVLRSNKKFEKQENVLEDQEEYIQENTLLEDLVDEFSPEITSPILEEKEQNVEDNSCIQKSNAVFEMQNSETFSTDELGITKDEADENSADGIYQTTSTPVSIPRSESNVSEATKIADGSPDVATDKANLLVVKTESTNVAPRSSAVEEEVETGFENVKTNSKVSKNFQMIPKNGGKSSEVTQVLSSSSTESFLGKPSTSNLFEFQRFETWNNFGIKSALKGDERKGGFVSPYSNSLKTSENSFPQDPSKTSSGSMVAEVLSQKPDMPFLKNLEQHFEGGEAVSTGVQPKIAVNAYETIQQNHIEDVQGIIATLEQKMDELKRSRRNSATVKIDLENGESLNCHVTLVNSDVTVRFSALEENFKAQILKHWEFLRNFAQIRRLNLSDPYFNTQVSL